jgi:hypothetical protein
MYTTKSQSTCRTCIEPDYSADNYATVETYQVEQDESTTTSKKSSGSFQSVESSVKKMRIRELNKLVSKWR